MLYEFLCEESLYCLNTFFEKSPQRKLTWISPGKAGKNEIDFVLSNNRKICRDVTVLNNFGAGNDHRLVRAAFRINIKIERKKLFHKENFPTIEEIENRREEYQHKFMKKLEPIEKCVEKNRDTNETKRKHKSK